MPDVSLLTPLGELYRSMLPIAYRDSPDHLAVVHSTAKEMERLLAAVEEVRAQFSPATATVLLGVWEAMVRVTVEPVGLTLEERRRLVFAGLARIARSPSGLDWKAGVTALIGPTWTYMEHIPEELAETNEIANPKFALDSAGWELTTPAGLTSVIAQRERMPDDPTQWGWRAQLRQANDTTLRQGGVAATAAARLPVVPGDVISAMADYYSIDESVSGSPRLLVAWYTAGGTNFATVTTALRVPAGRRGTLVANGLVAPATAAFVAVQGVVYTTTANDLLDGVWTRFRVARRATVSAYADGDSDNWRWTGTANASSSVQGTVPENTIRVIVPFSPGSTSYAALEALLRVITPAHVDIELVYEAGFVLDESQLDEEVLG